MFLDAQVFRMPYVDFQWPMDKIPMTEGMLDGEGFEPYVSGLVEDISEKLRHCIHHRILSCFRRGCVSQSAHSGGLLGD